MARDPGMEARLTADLTGTTGLVQTSMFGGLCRMWHGNLLCGADHTGLLFRLGKGRDLWALEPGIVQPMVMGDRRMMGWVRLPAAHAPGAALRRRLVAAAQDFAVTRPAT